MPAEANAGQLAATGVVFDGGAPEAEELGGKEDDDLDGRWNLDIDVHPPGYGPPPLPV